MVQREALGLVLVAKRKAWAADLVLAAQPTGQAADESCLAAAQVADQFNDFAAAELMADGFAKPCSGVGACGFGSPGLLGTHMLRIVARGRQ